MGFQKKIMFTQPKSMSSDKTMRLALRLRARRRRVYRNWILPLALLPSSIRNLKEMCAIGENPTE